MNADDQHMRPVLDPLLRDLLRDVQIDAWKAGMTRAALIALRPPNDKSPSAISNAIIIERDNGTPFGKENEAK